MQTFKRVLAAAPRDQVARVLLVLLAGLCDDEGDDKGENAAAALAEPGLVPIIASLLTSEVADAAANTLRMLTILVGYPQVYFTLPSYCAPAKSVQLTGTGYPWA